MPCNDSNCPGCREVVSPSMVQITISGRTWHLTCYERVGRRLVLVVDGKQRTYVADDDGLMWSYRTPQGRRWVGRHTLVEMFARAVAAALPGTGHGEPS